jgi:PQQ-dependent dehydrogenase (methanol/ethanol family)
MQNERMRFVRFVAWLGLAPVLFAQPPSADSERGKVIFGKRCEACHGQAAAGGDRGPAIAGNREMRRKSFGDVRGIIHDGRPQSGMPSFDLPGAELDDVAFYIFGLNTPAANAHPPGNRAAGERFFFGAGKCAGCHMVKGRGSAVGPDLSDIGHELTVAELRESLAEPSARIARGYDLVSVQLRGGAVLHGFARNRSNFDVQLQDLQGGLHLLHSGDYTSVRDEARSLMPAATLEPAAERDLIAYLANLTGVQPGATAPASANKTGLPFERVLNPKRGEWPSYNGRLDANRYSELEQINNANVGRLALKWNFPVDFFRLETTPVVVDGIMYVTGPNSIYSLDALTGREIWRFTRPRTPGVTGDGATGINRGVAVLGDKVFLITDNAHMLAVNRTTGRLMWEQTMPKEKQYYGGTSAPLAIKDMIIGGVAGADEGIRGFIVAYKADTGEEIWRHWTVPLKGEPGSETWTDKYPDYGGASTWLTGSYDSSNDTLYWPTGNPYPDWSDLERPGDNLYTNCMLALNPSDGSLKWYFQFTPHDVHDWDATEPPVLVDAKFRGQDRKLLLHADRNGFFYVLDRNNGKFLLGTRFVEKLTWASGIGPDGRPQLLPANIPPHDGEVGCPSVEGATNWMSTAYSPQTRLYYVMALEACAFYVTPPAGNKIHRPHVPEGRKYLRALDIESGKIVWEAPQVGHGDSWSGVLATAGNLVFYGTDSGAFAAVDARTGKPLWHFDTSLRWKSSPMTFTIAGKQYIAISSGPNVMCFGLMD